MANTDRRRFLKAMLGAVAGAAGTVVLASAATAKEEPCRQEPNPEKAADIQERADHLATTAGANGEEVPVSAFFNAGFRNGFGGGFRNGAFNNGFGGGFRNAGFNNGFGGGFRNGGFANGFGGGFRNGAFRNW